MLPMILTLSESLSMSKVMPFPETSWIVFPTIQQSAAPSTRIPVRLSRISLNRIHDLLRSVRCLGVQTVAAHDDGIARGGRRGFVSVDDVL